MTAEPVICSQCGGDLAHGVHSPRCAHAPNRDGRERLPARRPSVNRKFRHDGRSYHAAVGKAADGRPLEVFCHGSKLGSSMDALIDDACIVVSLLLQRGQDPADLAERLRRHERDEDDEPDRPASLIAAIVNIVVEEMS